MKPLRFSGVCFILIGTSYTIQYFTSIDPGNLDPDFLTALLFAQIILFIAAGLGLASAKFSETAPIPESINPNAIIGNPIRIDSLQVAQHDFPKKMTRYHANKMCSSLGEGWRLPTRDELNKLYLNGKSIGGFRRENYWSSTEFDDSKAWYQRFSNGFQ